MTPTVITVVLPPELQIVQARWAEADRAAQESIFAAEIAPVFAPLFAELPLHGAPRGMPRPRALVSVLGLSWQPVALMAAWVRPEQMLVLGTAESLSAKPGGESVRQLIARIAGIDRESIEFREIPDPGETEIYREIRQFVDRHKALGRVGVDPTGGKKSMSASTALAGFLSGALLLYVDYAEYHEVNRIPVAGTEYPRLLANPLDVDGVLEIDSIRHAFNGGDFKRAKEKAYELTRLLYDPREASALALLAQAYGDWSQFRFGDGAKGLAKLKNEMDRFAHHGHWRWAGAVEGRLGNQRALLERLARTEKRPRSVPDGLPLVLNHLASAQRAIDSGEASVGLMLTYAAVERFVDLCLFAKFELDDDRPNYLRLTSPINMDRYHEVGKALVGPFYEPQDLPRKISFAAGVQLLAALTNDILADGDFKELGSIATDRNKCEFEHGFLPIPPDQDKVQRYLGRAESIISRAAGGMQKLKSDLAEYRFPVI